MAIDLIQISKQFNLDGLVKEIKPLKGGLINDTFFIETEGRSPNYILQRKNKDVFRDIPNMMENINIVTSHLKNKIVESKGDPLRETLTIIRTQNNKLYHQDSNKDYWTACHFIENTITYEKADSLELATQGGRGIGKFQAMLSDMKTPLFDSLPGFHNIKYRFEQWDKTLLKDPIGRKKEVEAEINWIEQHREQMITFWNKVESGEIPTRITHNDTKISNILFDKQNKALSVIDLDTVLNSTCLNDYGDAIRSYANAGLEDDENLSNVYVDMNIFEAFTKGYLSQAHTFLIPSELNNIAFSAKYITFEQTLRFLMDYIDGDTYYKVKNKEHNLVRTYAQHKLFQSIDQNFIEMNKIITNEIKTLQKDF